MEDKKTLLLLSGIMVGTILLITVFAAIVSRPAKPVNVEIGNSYYKGPNDARVTIVEFSDFQCPGCETFATTVLPELEKLYIDKVKFVYKFFPLYEIHNLANLSAQSAWCAGQVDLATSQVANKFDNFWKYHDLLMNNSSEWESNQDKFIEYAKSLNLNADEFKTCQNGQAAQETVLADRKQGERLGVNSTPSFYVNGESIVGLQSLENWKKIIDSKLSK